MHIPQGQGGWSEDSLQMASHCFYHMGSREHQAARLSRKRLYHGVISPAPAVWVFFLFVLFFVHLDLVCQSKVVGGCGGNWEGNGF